MFVFCFLFVFVCLFVVCFCFVLRSEDFNGYLKAIMITMRKIIIFDNVVLILIMIVYCSLE